MNERTRETPAAQARRENPTLNQSGDARNPSSPPERAERLAGHPNAGNADYEQGRADALNEQQGGVGIATSGNNGLGFNGEFRLGDITIAIGGGKGLILRHARVGTETEVAEAVVEGVLEEAFFKRKIDEDGSENLGLTGKS